MPRKRDTIEAQVRRLNRMQGRPEWAHTPGAWYANYNRYYGGYIIEQVCNEAGGVCHPLGEGRRSAGEMVRTLEAVTRALEIEQGLRRPALIGPEAKR